MECAVDEIVTVADLVSAHRSSECERARVAVAAARSAATKEWAIDGWLSAATWLAHHCRLSRPDAARMLREGRFPMRYPAIATAALTGRLSVSQINVVRTSITAAVADLFEEHHLWLLDAIEPLDAADTDRVMREWRERADAICDAPPPRTPDRSWTMTTLPDGSVMGRFVFDPAVAGAVEHAVQTAHSWDGPDDTRSPGARSADAVAAVFAFFNANHESEGTPRHRPHIELHAEIDAAGDIEPLVTDTGRVMPAWAGDALSCDCVIHRVMRSRSAVLDYGRSTRSVALELFRAVAARDGGCRFPACTRKQAWCDAHHIRWWRDHGETSLDNLLLLCSHHHHLIHRQSWSVALHPDGDVTFNTPDGRPLVSRPRGHPRQRVA